MLKRSTKIDLEILNIEDDGSHLFCKIKINGKNARILIDSGASRSVFDQDRIQSFIHPKDIIVNEKLSTGLGTNSMPTSTVEVKSLKIGDLRLENFQAVVLDLQHVNVTYGNLGHTPIDGVLGNDILLKYRAVIDYGNKVLKLHLK